MAEMVKKTMEMNQEYIDRLREIFGVRTEKEAVNKALEMALIDDEIIKAHRRMREAGDVIEKVFE
jgi:Arc/MetJ family transcription regulator